MRHRLRVLTLTLTLTLIQVRDIAYEWAAGGDRDPLKGTVRAAVSPNPFASFLLHHNPDNMPEAKKRFAASIGVWWALSCVALHPN